MALTILQQKGTTERFTSAVKEGDISQTRDLLKSHLTLVTLRDPSYKDYTPLHWAAEKGSTGIVEVILEVMAENNIAFDAKDEDGETPLHIAAQYGHLDTVKLLILNGAKADAVDNEGYTALHRAAEDGFVDIAKELLMSQDINVNCADKDGNTPLHLACQESKIEMVNLLLEKGANVSAVGEHDYIPLHWAAQEGSIKIASMLLKHNSSLSAIDHWKNTPLHLAALKGHVKTTKYLVNKGANLEALEENNKTPLQLAEKKGTGEKSTEVIDLLRLMAFKQKRKEFDQNYGNDDDGGIKTEIEEKLFKIKDVVTVGSGVNKEWRENGKYGGLCVLVEVSVDPEEFKADHPEYKNEPYFIRQCSTKRFVNECHSPCVGKHIKAESSESRGTIGFVTSDANNNKVRGVTAFHVLHPDCEQNDEIDEKTYHMYRDDIDGYNSKRKDLLSNRSYYVNNEEPVWSFVGGIYDSYLDVGIVETDKKACSWRDTYDFEWPSILKELNQKDFHKIFMNYSANEGEIVVYHNGCVSGETSYGELDTLQAKHQLFSTNTGKPVFLIDHACVITISPEQLQSYSGEISIHDLNRYSPNHTESVDSDDSESESENQSDGDDDDDDDDNVIFTEQLHSSADDDGNSAEGFTSPGDSGCLYYVKIRGIDKEYKAPIAIHRCRLENLNAQNGFKSFGSRVDKLVLSSIGKEYNIRL